MTREQELYRVEFHASHPTEQNGNARFTKCCTMVGNWRESLDAVRHHRKKYWIEIFDDITGERIAGPLAPETKPPDETAQ